MHDVIGIISAKTRGAFPSSLLILVTSFDEIGERGVLA